MFDLLKDRGELSVKDIINHYGISHQHADRLFNNLRKWTDSVEEVKEIRMVGRREFLIKVLRPRM